MCASTRLQMTPEQRNRSGELNFTVEFALRQLASEPLNLDVKTLAALDRVKLALEEFETLRLNQPISHHNALCDALDCGPDGIVKPCNCGGAQ